MAEELNLSRKLGEDQTKKKKKRSSRSEVKVKTKLGMETEKKQKNNNRFVHKFIVAGIAIGGRGGGPLGSSNGYTYAS